MEETGKITPKSNMGSTTSAQLNQRMPVLGAELDELPVCTPIDELLKLYAPQPERIRDTPHAYQMAKNSNMKRGNESCQRGRGARINSISLGIAVTPSIDAFNDPRENFYKNRGFLHKVNI